MKLHNTLSRSIDEVEPVEGKKIRIYSCGPTVYDHAHIGNLASYIYADTLRRALKASGFEVEHVMNITDVDDKTIRRSKEKYPNLPPKEALKKLTEEYTEVFLRDMEEIGNDVSAIRFVKATESIPQIQELIQKLYKDGFAYVTDDGVYFSIRKYRASGKKYGQLLEISDSNTSEARIDNDEYDKENIHDFALWKSQKAGEPSWEFELDGHNLAGRPGWHIECSAMSVGALGQPFDIHTGGVDLIFPHHENEIAQSTAGKDEKRLAKFFFHNEHIHVDGKKMSKSLSNFYTLNDIKDKGFDPLAFRLMVLQSHYRSQSNFSWEILRSDQQMLKNLRAITIAASQERDLPDNLRGRLDASTDNIVADLAKDLATPEALASLYAILDVSYTGFLNPDNKKQSEHMLSDIDELLSLGLGTQEDIPGAMKGLIEKREEARLNKDWDASDAIRDELLEKGISVNDTEYGTIWYRT